MDIQEIIASAWEQPSKNLKGKVALALQQVSDILLVEDLRTTSHKESHLQRTMGDFAGASLDLSAVSKVLGKRSDKSALDAETKIRVESLKAKLSEFHKNFETKLPACKISRNSVPEIVEADAVKHLNVMAECFKLIRMAWLERNAKFEPSVHQRFFADFSWENLNNEEVALCPPFVVLVSEQAEKDFYFQTLLPLLTSGLPIKVILERKQVRASYHAFNRSSALRCALEVEMLPVALNGVYVLQDTVARPQAVEHLKAGLVSPRPGLFSIFQDTDSERCDRAVQSRAFPLFRYDPDKSDVFLKRFDLTGNPDTTSLWSNQTLEYTQSNGKKDRLQKRYTFADFAATEAAFQAEYSDLPAAQESRSIELADYLELASSERSGKIPFVTILGSGNVLVKRVPSMKIVAQTADKRHLWKSLCEVSGINNPYVTELEAQIRKELTAQFHGEMAKQKQDLQAQMDQEKQDAVSIAMKNLASKLAGLSAIDVKEVIAKPAVVKSSHVASTAPVAPAPIVESDEPYIETKLCTGCDECITIDKNIFAYNANKQAYIKDPKGGPYKNLLKASQKCSAKIIHPGKAPV